MFFLKKFRPEHSENRMKAEGDVASARERFFSTQNKILYHLIKRRFSWMNDWIRSDDTKIVEIGSGSGLSKEFITNKNLLLTDVTLHPWIDKKVDVTTDLDVFEDNSLDVVIASHVLHHIPYPKAFIQLIGTKLKSDGRLLIQDPYASVLFKVILRIMKHEGFDELVDVDNILIPCNDPNDPWSANCSVGKLLFDRGGRNFGKMKLVKAERGSCFLLLLSGGTIAKTWYPRWVGERGVSFIKKVDYLITRIAPRLFACEYSVVLRKM